MDASTPRSVRYRSTETCIGRGHAEPGDLGGVRRRARESGEPEGRSTEPERHQFVGVRPAVEQQVATGDADVELP